MNLIKYLFLAFILCSLSCQKSTVNPIEIDPVDSIPKDTIPKDSIPTDSLKETIGSYNMNSFFIDSAAIKEIYAGKMFSLNETDEFFTLSSLSGTYKPLAGNFLLSVLNTKDFYFTGIPSYERNQKFVQEQFPEDDKPSTIASATGGLAAFKDYTIINRLFLHSEFGQKAFQTIVGNGDTQVKKKAGTYTFWNVNSFDLFMEVTSIDEHISEEDRQQLIRQYNPYLVGSVSYGYTGAIFLEGNAEQGTLREILSQLMNEKELGAAEIKILQDAKLSVAAINGADHSFIKSVSGIVEMKKAIKEAQKYSKLYVKTPLKYSLTSLKNLATYQKVVQVKERL